ncbi:MAG: VldV [Candidatus Rokuibacteriota bacterium]|nr:MAG: VldV [Candidatus Rokubacteria bacterium]
MAWHLEGSYFENCNCDVVCPCTVSLLLPATNERCQLLMAFHVASGEIEGVDVGGLSLGILADTPGQMTDGGWRVGVLMDEKASEAQAQALAAVFGGEKGGPMGEVAPLIGEMLGMERTSIDYADEGVRHRAKMGDFVDLEVEDFAPEGATEATQLRGTDHAANSTLTISRATRSRISAFGIDFSAEGKSGFSAPFSWAG